MDFFESEPLTLNALQYPGCLMRWDELFDMIKRGTPDGQRRPTWTHLTPAWVASLPPLCLSDITKEFKAKAKRALIGRYITPWRRN